MISPTANRATGVAAHATHAHHWIIDEANGPESAGRCRTCGAEKQFRNWLPEADFVTNEEHRSAA
jgi:hypothetical protein